jgi:hypothetical protein
VVGVTRGRVGVVAAGFPDPHPLHATTIAAAAAVAAASRAGRITPNNTGQTLTSEQLGSGAPTDTRTRLRHLRQFVGPALTSA